MSSIFLVDQDNRLVQLDRTDYDSEDLFQRLLGDHPAMLNLAAGPEGRLLLVRRELAVPDSLNGSDRWSLDHLFLDRQGVPVLVEVKQASDTRARREVVAQMLDYAANGVAYWPIDRLILSFRETAQRAGREPDAQMADFLEGGDPEAFWRGVEANLVSGRVRMLFVADRIPKELARIVEFLNQQMRPAEVLAIEIEQFTSSAGVRTLVPRLVGQTERAVSTKAITTPVEPLSEADWLASLTAAHGDVARTGAEKALSWFKAQGLETGVTDSQEAISASIARSSGRRAWPFFLRRSSGRLEIPLSYLSYATPYAGAEQRRELLTRLRELRATSFRASDKLTGWPSFALGELSDARLWGELTTLASEIVQKLRES